MGQVGQLSLKYRYMTRENKHDKYLITLWNLEGDLCTWRIPEPETYGDFFICFQGQHEIGGGASNMFILI